MWRNVLVIVAGVFVGIIVIGAIQWAGHQLFPPPRGVDFNDAAAVASYLEQLPITALLFVLLAWFFGAVDGAMLAAWLSPSRPWLHALIVVLVLAAAALANLLLLPHPQWFVLITPVVYLAAWLIGGKVGVMLHDRRRAGVSR